MLDLWNIMAYRWWDWMGSMFWQASLLILVVSGLDLLFLFLMQPQNLFGSSGAGESDDGIFS